MTIVPATMQHVTFVAQRMREADRSELLAIGLQPLQALEYSIAKSMQSWTWMHGDRPACIWGVDAESILGSEAHPWLLTTDLVEQRPIAFLRYSLHALKRMREAFPVLTNWVDARHVVCVRWLEWLGFEVEAPIPVGPFNVPFHRFILRS